MSVYDHWNDDEQDSALESHVPVEALPGGGCFDIGDDYYVVRECDAEDGCVVIDKYKRVIGGLYGSEPYSMHIHPTVRSVVAWDLDKINRELNQREEDDA